MVFASSTDLISIQVFHGGDAELSDQVSSNVGELFGIVVFNDDEMTDTTPEGTKHTFTNDQIDYDKLSTSKVSGQAMDKEKCNGNLQNETTDVNLDKRSLISDESKIVTFVCSYCNEHLDTGEKLRDHKYCHRKNQELFSCLVCIETFALKEYLVIHERIHTAPVASTTEGILSVSLASTNDNLPNKARQKQLEHKQIHSKEKPYKCENCLDYFETKNKLLGHKRLHKELFSCLVCNKIFKSKRILFNHEEIHTIYKTFTCELCNKVFNNEYAYVLHKKSVHKDFMKEKESFNNFVNVNENISDNHAIKTDQEDEIKEEIDIEAVETIGEDPLTVPEEEDSYDYSQSFIFFHEI